MFTPPSGTMAEFGQIITSRAPPLSHSRSCWEGLVPPGDFIPDYSECLSKMSGEPDGSWTRDGMCFTGMKLLDGTISLHAEGVKGGDPSRGKWESDSLVGPNTLLSDWIGTNGVRYWAFGSKDVYSVKRAEEDRSLCRMERTVAAHKRHHRERSGIPHASGYDSTTSMNRSRFFPSGWLPAYDECQPRLAGESRVFLIRSDGSNFALRQYSTVADPRTPIISFHGEGPVRGGDEGEGWKYDGVVTVDKTVGAWDWGDGRRRLATRTGYKLSVTPGTPWGREFIDPETVKYFEEQRA